MMVIMVVCCDGGVKILQEGISIHHWQTFLVQVVSQDFDPLREEGRRVGHEFQGKGREDD